MRELARLYAAQSGLNAIEYIRLGMAGDAYRCARAAARLARAAEEGK